MSKSMVDAALPSKYKEPVQKRKTRIPIQVSLSPDLYELVVKVAREEARPPANLVWMALVRYLRDTGALPPESG